MDPRFYQVRRRSVLGPVEVEVLSTHSAASTRAQAPPGRVPQEYYMQAPPPGYGYPPYPYHAPPPAAAVESASGGAPWWLW